MLLLGHILMPGLTVVLRILQLLAITAPLLSDDNIVTLLSFEESITE